jgi:hypothetical protein
VIELTNNSPKSRHNTQISHVFSRDRCVRAHE